MICITTASLVSTPDSTIAVEDTVINIEDTNNNTQKELTVTMDNSGRLKGYFCSDVVFNVSHKVLSDLEISVLRKGLGFSPTPTFINEADLRRDFANLLGRCNVSGSFEMKSRKTLVKLQHLG